MRHIYTDKINETQQGCIFNGAVADGFEDCTVYGLIITPRCDIAQRKVTTVHYLPIVKLEDWKRIILTPLSQKERIDKKVNEVKALLKKHRLPDHLMNRKYRLSDNDLEKAIPNKGLFDSISSPLKDFWDLQDIDKCYDNLSTWKNYQNRMHELARGQNERYLLVEKWNNGNQFLVICLTEIYHLSLDTALKLKDSLLVRDIDFDKNDLLKSNSKLDSYHILAQISSPFIEYVTQHLSNAFFRIGIEDWEDEKQTINQIL